MKILGQISDLGGCYQYRVRIPFAALNKYDVSIDSYPFIPNAPGGDQFKLLVDLYSRYDAVLLQRCYVYSVAKKIKDICDFLGIPLIFETDDDYLNLPKTNPAYYSIIDKSFFNVKRTDQEIEQARMEALEGYREIIRMSDMVTVSTEELKRSLSMYNKNIVVLPNNVESVYYMRDHNPLSEFVDPQDPTKMKIEGNFGLWRIPDYMQGEEGRLLAIPRVGYTGTVSHQGADFKTIEYHWEKLISKHTKDAWFVYIGDKYFWDLHEKYRSSRKLPQRNLYIPQYEYALYMYNYRNLDIALAPLFPNVFNMSKSDIKAVEAAAWGIPCVLPNYITYNRTFKHGENCLMYNNGKEFMEYTELLMADSKLRFEMGQKALHYVEQNRLEYQHSEKRYQAYKSLIDKSYRLQVFGGED